MSRRQISTTQKTDVAALQRCADEWKRVAAHLQLSHREAQIAQLVVDAMSDKEIAKALAISLPTVRTHLRHIFLRLRIAGRVELVLRIVTAHFKSIGDIEAHQ